MPEPLDPVREWVRLLNGPLPPEFKPKPSEELMRVPDSRKTIPPKLTKGDHISTILCACGNLKPMSEMPFMRGPCVNFTDNACRGCLKDLKGLALLVCARCKVVVGRAKPDRDKVSGFELKAGRVYHLDKCPVCSPPELGKIACTSRLIEKVVYERRQGTLNPLKEPRL